MNVPESHALTFTLPHDPVPGAGLRKPPPIRVGAEGIAAKTVQDEQRIDGRFLERLCRLPAFQMFIMESFPDIVVPYPRELEHLQDFRLIVFLKVEDEDVPGKKALVNRYFEWHAEKGYWPNETPLGELKG